MKDYNEVTGDRVKQIASLGLRSPLSLSAAEIRAVCASALTQSPPRKPLLKRVLGL